MRTGDLAPPSIGLYWIPLGAGGNGFVRLNGRLYEAVVARRAGRSRRDLYHTALEVVTAEGRFIVENAWPSPDRHTELRGVAIEGPVFGRSLARLRWFRYEVRCWRDGVIPDAACAVGGVVVVSEDPVQANTLLELVGDVPPLVWGRDQLGAGEMWNSNSVVAWLLARAGLDPAGIEPPAGGHAPGWRAGLMAAGAEPAKAN